MRTAFALAAAALLLAANTAVAQAPPRTRGTISAVNGDTIALRTRQGATLTAVLGADSKVLGVTHAQLADVKPNSFIGTATAPQPDGTLRALEVTVFPEAMRGTGEGHYDWDLGQGSTMTNGAVGALVGSSGRTMTVTYKGGQKQVVVPPDVPVVDIAPGTRALLVPGAKVVVFGPRAADGHVDARMVVAGEHGVTPPM